MGELSARTRPTSGPYRPAQHPQREPASAALRVSRLDGIDALRSHGADLDRLNSAAARPSPFFSGAFLAAYAEHCEYFPDGLLPRLFLVWEGGQVVAALPMRLAFDRFLGLHRPKLECLATHDSEQPGVICAPQDEERATQALLAHLIRREPGWGMLELVCQRPGNVLHRLAHATAGMTHRVRDYPAEQDSEITLIWPDLHAYFRSLEKKMRSNISRQVRRLYAAGTVQLVFAEGPAAVWPWLDAYVQLDSRSWKVGTASSISRHPLRLEFFRNLMAGRAGCEPYFIGVLLEGQLISGLIIGSNGAASPRDHGSWCLEMSYDESRADLGPGQLLLLLAVGESTARGDRYLNFLQSFAYYKHRWNAEPLNMVNVQLIRRTSLHNLRATIGDAKRWLAARRGRKATAAAPQPQGEHSAAAPGAIAPDPAQAQQLAAVALAQSGVGLRLLDRQAAATYLPFPIE